MTHIKIYRLFLLALLVMTLSSCTVKETLYNYVSPADEEWAEEVSLLESELTFASPTEQLTELVDPEMCITQELDALQQTGSWSITEIDIDNEDLGFDFPVVKNKQVKMYLDLFQNSQRKYFELWLARSSRYLPYIQEELKKAGLPLDLAYLAMIESGFNQRAYSRAKAVGLWQFMVGTGRDYNLRVDKYVDERRDMKKSTRAAVAYLSDLYGQFGDWHLAVAAYNGGPGRISNGLKKYKTNDFWELAEKNYLHLETKRYVPKLIAAMIIAKNPEKFGFTNVAYMPPMQYETVEVGPGIGIDALALVSGTNAKEILLLNQELNTNKTPLNQRKYSANIPAGTVELAQKNLSRLQSVVKTGYKTHIIRKGETLTAICSKYNVNKTTVLKVNNLRSAKLAAGQRLRIPYSDVHYALLSNKQGAAIADTGDSMILHKVRPGETISKIADRYQIPAAMIVEWNGLTNAHKIRAGQQLALHVIQADQVTTMTPTIKPRSQKTQVTVSAPPADNRIVLSAAKKKKPIGGDHLTFNWYQVKAGDTLWKISQQFGLSPHEIKLWNNLKSNLIHPGSRLKLKDV